MKAIFTLFLLTFLSFVANAQLEVKGTVTDAAGEPLIGVNVIEKGTNRGTITDQDGAYTLRVASEAAILQFSYIGFTSQEVPVNGRVELNVVLQEGLTISGVEVVGSRSLNRSITETPVAIDIIDIREVTNTVGQLDVNQLLQYAAPSFNSNRQSGADGADHIDPATLRGLGPDQTLVLLNGKRRHQSSLINIFGSRGRGNTGTDLNAIPVSAIERIEILRDGASAQYGSDAIAGVINIVLKSSVNEFSGSLNTGMYYAKAPSSLDVLNEESFDGQTIQLSGNYGTSIGESGFVNVTLDYLSKDNTNRPADPSVFSIYRRQFGEAAANNFGTFFNARLPFKNSNTYFYAFGGYNYRFTDAFAWTRDPDSDRNIPAIYPNGFDPHITSRITDRSLSAGLRSKIRNWDVDFNNTVGTNRFHYIIDKTLNASLLEKSPTRFDAGGHAFSQNTTGLHFSQYFPQALSGVNVAFGSEYRLDNYQIFAGEEGSYRNYGIIDTVIDGRLTTFDVLGRAAGSQGFPGFQPDNELNEFRSNLAAYFDSEFDFTSSFMIAAAIRFEHYSDFGNTLNAKLASRLKINEAISLRGSVSTGFRAPSLAQIYYNTTFTDFVSGVPIDKIIAKNNSPITRALGIPELKEEKALNASLGITARFGSFTATIDGYYVDIKDRIVLTGAFEDTDPEIGDELQALNVGAAQFFTNAIDTRTTGVDAILTYTHSLGNAGRLRLAFAGNFNKMELGDVHTNDKLKGKEDIYFGNREKLFLLASAPESKLSLVADYRQNRLGVNLRFTRFGEISLEDFIGTIDVYEARIVTDLALSYQVTPNIMLNIGSANLLNVYPTQQDTETETGGLWDAVQMGSNGAFYFAKLGFRF
ncbi:MAG: TonB-dependent receptor [Saprospiraceae bacterium]|nr:TonB-dependent receptor [Saprospiraceae bacterium]